MAEQESPFQSIGLSDFIDRIRFELESSESRRIEAKKGPLFEVESIELELSFTVSKSKEVNGGFKVWIVSAEVGGGVDSATVHKAKIVLQIAPQAARNRVPGARPYPSSNDVEPL